MTNKETSLSTITLVLLREHRLSLGLPQSYIAARLGITSSAYNKIENGESRIDLSRVFEIAAAFQMQPHAIIDQAEKISLLLSARGWDVMPIASDESYGNLQAALTPDKKGFTPSMAEYGFIAIPNSMIQIVNEPIQRVS